LIEPVEGTPLHCSTQPRWPRHARPRASDPRARACRPREHTRVPPWVVGVGCRVLLPAA